MKSSIVFIFNPAAKKASKRNIAKAFHFLESRGYKVEVIVTGQRGDAERFAKEAVKKSPFLIIAAGGDGTFNEVINGIVGSDVPMAILPLGITNVLAKELGIHENVEDALEIALSSIPKTVSLGKIVQDPEFGSGRYFCLMAGIGFDGEVVYGLNEAFKKLSGKGAHIYSALKTLSGFCPGELIFNIDGENYSGYTAVIGKSAKYGGNYKITPDAKLTDPFLYACIFKGKKRLDILRYIFGITAGRHLRFRDVRYTKATSVEVQGDTYIQIDGDYFGKAPATVNVVPNIVRMVF